MKLPTLLALITVLVLPACRATPAITLDNLSTWARAIRPTSAERGWLRIPWIPSYRDGVAAAVEQERPLLVWVMNGHPLGCT